MWAANTQIVIVSFLIFFSPSERVECKFTNTSSSIDILYLSKWKDDSGENIKPDSKSEKIKYYFD